MIFPCFVIAYSVLLSGGFKIAPLAEVSSDGQTSVVTETKNRARLTDARISDIVTQLTNDKIYMSTTPESPYLRLGFHIAASYDSVQGQGGWGELPTRATLQKEGLLDDIMIVYWDVLESYYESTESIQDMSKADFMSFAIYMYSKTGIFTPNVTWRAGRPDSTDNAGSHMITGRPSMGPGMDTTYKPQPSMTIPAYLREWFGRLGIHDDEEIVLLMSSHAAGSARGMPYLGEFPGTYINSNNISESSVSCGVIGCYMDGLLTKNWVLGCPESCRTCQWPTESLHSDTDSGDESPMSVFNVKDPYNTTSQHAPKNYTDSNMWGPVCTENLKALGLYEFTDSESKSMMRLPIEMALLQDNTFRSIMTKFTTANDKDLVKAFATAYSKMLEVGVPEGQLYDVAQINGTVPPFSGFA
mmetsp:Transcript_24987/g.65558  ORF Transcript_24987/g.65558 Transcript_24987/m.65558 type:complete len:414 (-) Transcript_24987:275-1516(-)